MYRPLQDAIRAIWEVLLLVPMPWRAGLVVLIVVLFLHWTVSLLLPWLIVRLARLGLFFVEGIASLLLLPEYLITKQRRQSGHRPLPGTYAFGDILQGIVGLVDAVAAKLPDTLPERRGLPRRWVVLVTVTPIVLWYVRLFLYGTSAAIYINRGLGWWNSLQEWVRTGEWTFPG